jgi:hypothetical protein
LLVFLLVFWDETQNFNMFYIKMVMLKRPDIRLPWRTLVHRRKRWPMTSSYTLWDLGDVRESICQTCQQTFPR